MIKLKAHGRDWILRMCKIPKVYCLDCESTNIHFDIPEAHDNTHWFDCLCEKCDCTFRIEYEERS